ncbi:MAG: hypothetical protein Q4P71_04035 [Actinomycetaceae bacterium]|nr:hypothetical protein [Actinomycetaceae bacterium]
MGETQKKRKPRRRAVAVSRVDQQLIARGKKPSWEAVRPPQPVAECETQVESARDRELRDNVPPHW